MGTSNGHSRGLHETGKDPSLDTLPTTSAAVRDGLTYSMSVSVFPQGRSLSK